jgi:hypothetical protein
MSSKNQALPASWNDADILLRLDELADKPGTREAFLWSRKLFEGMQKGEEPKEIASNSSDHEKYGRIATFFETVGTLAKHGLIKENLLYDRWLIYPFWNLFKITVKADRKRISPLIAENFEWVAKRNKRWVDSRVSKGASRKKTLQRKRSGNSSKRKRR